VVDIGLELTEDDTDVSKHVRVIIIKILLKQKMLVEIKILYKMHGTNIKIPLFLQIPLCRSFLTFQE